MKKGVERNINICFYGTHDFASEKDLNFTITHCYHNTDEELFVTLSNVNQRRGGTYTADAINKMRLDLFSPEHRREGVPHIGIVITDGESIDPKLTRYAARKAKRDGITMFAIGVGR